MTYQNIFDGGKGQALSAEKAAQTLRKEIPGAVDPDIDPELLTGIPQKARDPKIVNELSPVALEIAGRFLEPLFKSTQKAAVDQLAASNDPKTTSTMASSTLQEVATQVKATVNASDEPKMPATVDNLKPPKVDVPKKPPLPT
ncbi:hypothetical protein ABZ816_25920 [Actinosynnema sp. NPDC047251]|uniref:Uncharacterized protein n=1 Tax=Saccharothrix espanaensis (strain ATCC 51144 / DSM 44229 / JCM 9112 / NBRC 15066 / NRRL 15764) TaxID=1179773 RepID=K0K5L0_SACES|nr:hypothetical protein [Saccharothrix espanaensis]CCH31848.1 hypothetical protein BN6_45690 [Saccharothrix espanaensis DSM 44229]